MSAAAAVSVHGTDSGGAANAEPGALLSAIATAAEWQAAVQGMLSRAQALAPQLADVASGPPTGLADQGAAARAHHWATEAVAGVARCTRELEAALARVAAVRAALAAPPSPPRPPPELPRLPASGGSLAAASDAHGAAMTAVARLLEAPTGVRGPPPQLAEGELAARPAEPPAKPLAGRADARSNAEAATLAAEESWSTGSPAVHGTGERWRVSAGGPTSQLRPLASAPSDQPGPPSEPLPTPYEQRPAAEPASSRVPAGGSSGGVAGSAGAGESGAADAGPAGGGQAAEAGGADTHASSASRDRLSLLQRLRQLRPLQRPARHSAGTPAAFAPAVGAATDGQRPGLAASSSQPAQGPGRGAPTSPQSAATGRSPSTTHNTTHNNTQQHTQQHTTQLRGAAVATPARHPSSAAAPPEASGHPAATEHPGGDAATGPTALPSAVPHSLMPPWEGRRGRYAPPRSPPPPLAGLASPVPTSASTPAAEYPPHQSQPQLEPTAEPSPPRALPTLLAQLRSPPTRRELSSPAAPPPGPDEPLAALRTAAPIQRAAPALLPHPAAQLPGPLMGAGAPAAQRQPPAVRPQAAASSGPPGMPPGGSAPRGASAEVWAGAVAATAFGRERGYAAMHGRRGGPGGGAGMGGGGR
jgi:hypothetical protein